jgi:hypothetical protein
MRLSECHEPLSLPLSPVLIDQDPPQPWGLGRSIYSPEQMQAFFAFQQSSAVRQAYIADASELAFSRRSASGEWGLPISEYSKHAIVDLVGLSFIPLYRFLGSVSMIIILVLFFVGITRLTITVLFRAIVLGRTRGCGLWILAAFLGFWCHKGFGGQPEEGPVAQDREAELVRLNGDRPEPSPRDN